MTTVESTPSQLHQARRLEAMRQGRHALSVALNADIRLHPAAALLDGRPDTRGRRCGNCRFRRVINTGIQEWPKCLFGGPEFPRVTADAGTDVRRWWPACRQHEPRP